jgi:hypothetical protein
VRVVVKKSRVVTEWASLNTGIEIRNLLTISLSLLSSIPSQARSIGTTRWQSYQQGGDYTLDLSSFFEPIPVGKKKRLRSYSSTQIGSSVNERAAVTQTAQRWPHHEHAQRHFCVDVILSPCIWDLVVGTRMST